MAKLTTHRGDYYQHKTLDDMVFELENSLDSDFCAHVIDKFEKDPRLEPGIVGSGIDLEMKESDDLQISVLDDWKEEDDVFFKSLNDFLHNYDWSGLCPMIDDDSGYQIQRTRPGSAGYLWHNDANVAGDSMRALTFIWYLNDVPERDGGWTEFHWGRKIFPETGKLLVFPAGLTFIHRGVPPTKTTKYICTGWLYTPSFEGPQGAPSQK